MACARAVVVGALSFSVGSLMMLVGLVNPLFRKFVLFAVPATLLCLLLVSFGDQELTEQLFVHFTYYFSLLTLLVWTGLQLHVARQVQRERVFEWTRQNWRGLLVVGIIVGVAGWAVEPGFRLLSDEANLVGTSKNLFASKSATFTVSGKYYYERFFDVDVAIDQRPTLFPFLVSLVHTVLGYSYKNAFLLNLGLLPVFLLLSYRTAKTLGGETVGLVALLCIVAHPIFLMTVRSAGFDFLAVCLTMLVMTSVLDLILRPSPTRLALVWMNAALLADVRYESALFLIPLLGSLLAFQLITRDRLRPYAWLYALSPAYLLPRIWQSMLRGNVPKQEPGTVAFSLEHFVDNLDEYFAPVLDLSGNYPAHCAILMVLGSVGTLAWLRWLGTRLWVGARAAPRVRMSIFVGTWMALQVAIVFTYYWGRAQYPSAARLFMPIDTFLSFAAAWTITRTTERWGRLVPIFVSIGILATELPVATEGTMMNRLTQTRESARTWRYFEHLHQKNILIVTDRPNHFTIMNYGAMDFASARRDRYLFTALRRHLFQDVYVVQQIRISEQRPLAGYEIWPDRKLVPVYEFQNDADVIVRISKLVL